MRQFANPPWIVAAALFVSSCGSTAQSLIVGQWDAESALKLTAQFNRDGSARLTMFGQTLNGTYKLTGENELEWTVNGNTTHAKVHVTASELELTNDANQTIKYKRE